MNNIGNTDKEIGTFANSERELHGKDIWAVRLSEDIKDDKKVIVDGLRNMEEFDYFKTRFPDLVLIGIHTDREERLKRIQKRGRPDDAKVPISLSVLPMLFIFAYFLTTSPI